MATLIDEICKICNQHRIGVVSISADRQWQFRAMNWRTGIRRWCDIEQRSEGLRLAQSAATDQAGGRRIQRGLWCPHLFHTSLARCFDHLTSNGRQDLVFALPISFCSIIRTGDEHNSRSRSLCSALHLDRQFHQGGSGAQARFPTPGRMMTCADARVP